MLHCRVNDYDMAYIEVGQGTPLVCVHGSLCDYRVWSCVLGPLSRQHRVIAPSLRHFFPEHWDGVGNDYTMAQHVADTIGFIEALNAGPVHLMGHSRGGHIAFRVAHQRPDLLRRVVLAEPGGDLDASLAPSAEAPPPMRASTVAAAEKIAAGDIDGALAHFIDAIDGQGAWRALPAYDKQELRDNAFTLLGQLNEQRQPFQTRGSRGDPRSDAAGGRHQNAWSLADHAAGVGGPYSRSAGRDDPERHAFHVRPGPGAVLCSGVGVPGRVKGAVSASGDRLHGHEPGAASITSARRGRLQMVPEIIQERSAPEHQDYAVQTRGRA